MVRIICIGNRFAYPDNFGVLVYEKLKNMDLEYEVVEGGVGGLSLMPYFEDEAKILIVDYGTINKKIVTNKDIEKFEINEYNHATAFLYFLKTITKPYTIYVCNEEFENVDQYIEEILDIAKAMEWN